MFDFNCAQEETMTFCSQGVHNDVDVILSLLLWDCNVCTKKNRLRLIFLSVSLCSVQFFFVFFFFVCFFSVSCLCRFACMLAFSAQQFLCILITLFHWCVTLAIPWNTLSKQRHNEVDASSKRYANVNLTLLWWNAFAAFNPYLIKNNRRLLSCGIQD